MLKKMKVKYKLFLLVIIFILGFLIVGIYSNKIITDIKINGSMYKQIIMGKDLVADILPPPEYIVESHLTTYELLNETDKSKIEELIEYSGELEKAYDERHGVWIKDLPESDMKNIMVEESYTPAKEYFKVFNNEFVPYIKSGDKEKAKDILDNKLAKLYSEHRTNIDKVVEIVNKENSDMEVNVSSEIKFDLLMLILISLSIVIVVIIFCIYIIKSITDPLLVLKKHIQTIAIGDLTYNMPEKWLNSKDELSDIIKATNQMQNSIKEIIQGIKTETEKVNNVITISSSSIVEITDNLEEASYTIEELSSGVEETASLTEEINSISKEIEDSVENIANRSQEGALSASEISKKALELKDSSIKLQSEANETQMKIKNTMDEALEKIKEVDKIKTLTDTIFEISSKTNLLALNAAIESARAGEAGRGFSVVADQIKHLAEDSKITVNQIQNTVDIIFEAVDNLANISKETLNYIETKVVDSYKESILLGENYDKDAVYISELVLNLSATSEELLASIKTVTESIGQISKSNNQGAAGTNEVADKVIKIKNKANDVKIDTTNVKHSTEQLKNLVSKFKI